MMVAIEVGSNDVRKPDNIKHFLECRDKKFTLHYRWKNLITIKNNV